MVGGARVGLLVDSGASRSVMDRESARSLLASFPSSTELRKIPTTRFHVANGKGLTCSSLLLVDLRLIPTGRCKLVLRHQVRYPFFVLDLGGGGVVVGGPRRDGILGREALGYFGISTFKFGVPGVAPAFPGGVKPPHIPTRKVKGSWVVDTSPSDKHFRQPPSQAKTNTCTNICNSICSLERQQWLSSTLFLCLSDYHGFRWIRSGGN